MYNVAIMEDGRKPIKVIEPGNRFSLKSSLSSIWQYRELLILLSWKDGRIRYRQTAIGVLWAILQPLLAMLLFVFIFGRFQGISDTGIPYALFVYSGLLIWQFFATGITESSNSLLENGSIISKIYFPKIILPFAKVMTRLTNLLLSALLMVGLMLYYHYTPSLKIIIWIIPIVILLTLASASIGAVLAAINARFRDVQNILPYFIQLGMFVSSAIYSPLILGNHRWLIYFNPATGIIDLFRYALFSLPFPAHSLISSCFLTLLFLFIALFYFAKKEGVFSDII